MASSGARVMYVTRRCSKAVLRQTTVSGRTSPIRGSVLAAIWSAASGLSNPLPVQHSPHAVPSHPAPSISIDRKLDAARQQGTPVLVLTAWGDSTALQDQLPAEAFLEKP